MLKRKVKIYVSGLAILDVKFNSEVLCGEVGFPRLPMPVREACLTIRICYHSEKVALLGVRLMAGRQQQFVNLEEKG